MKILDDDGENKAVRMFLACYGGGGNKSIGTMKSNLQMSGFDGCWPEWCNTEHPNSHLTKGGAQLWIRHLFSLEPQPKQVTCQIYGHVVGACVECNTHIEAQQAAVPVGVLDAISQAGFILVKTQFGYRLIATGRIEAQGEKP